MPATAPALRMQKFTSNVSNLSSPNLEMLALWVSQTNSLELSKFSKEHATKLQTLQDSNSNYSNKKGLTTWVRPFLHHFSFSATNTYLIINQTLASIQLWTIMQRYDSESNSQQHFFCMFKLFVVNDNAKIRFWRQFTTKSFMIVIEGKTKPTLTMRFPQMA